jgi:hypothetical protein
VFKLALVTIMLPLLAACDDRSAVAQQKKLPLPKGESTFDAVLAKVEPVAPAHLLAEPASLAFPPQSAETESRQGVQLRNDGGAALTLGPLRVAPHSADFQLGGLCRAGLQLAPGASCSLDVTYRPRTAMPALGEIVIDQGGAGPSLFLPVSGGGPLAAAPPRAVETMGRARTALTYDRVRQLAALAVTGPEQGNPQRPIEEDYRAAGLPGVVSSFPLDRSRVLTADRYIPAVLENTVNSQLPGRAIAVVERPVFGEDGRMVLIPAGSRVIGHYRAQSKYGLARLDISWSRILRPDGGNINLEADAADVMGRAGIPGDLDERLAAKYGSSFLVSVIGAASDWALANSSTAVTSPLGGTTTVESGRTIAANRFGNDMDRLAQRMVEDNIDVRPVLTVPQGTRLLIIPTEDIWLRDPDHLLPVTPPKGKAGNNRNNPVTMLKQLLPGVAELLLQSPAVQKTAPLTANEILQSSLLQSLRAAADADAETVE